MKEPLPGLYLSSEDGSPSWAEAGGQLKRRHFVIEGQTLKLFGRRGKTYKGHLNLLAVTALKVASESGAPPGALELQIKASRSRTQTCVLVPDHSVEELFMELGNAVPSHVVELDLWRRHMGSRPAVTSELYPREYRVGKTLGTGTFGKVKLAQRADGAIFAIKCLNRSRLVVASQTGRLAREIRLLRMLNHPNVIRLHEVLHTPSEMLLVMEYVDGGDLLEVLNTRARFTEAEVRHLFNQVCSGVSFCHSLGVAHRDLKPENVLIGKRTPDGNYLIKVADFGLSTLMRADEMLSTACGSPHYVAPEILTFDGGAAYDGLLSDVWSLGVMLHVMLCYKLPFEADSTQLLYKKIRQGLPSLPESLSPAAASLLSGMLAVEPSKRMTLVQVAQHEWPQLQANAPPLIISQTVAAAVDDAACASLRLSASNLFRLGSDASSSDEAQLLDANRLRRAFTFDHLPAGSDEQCDALLFEPARLGEGRAAARSSHAASMRDRGKGLPAIPAYRPRVPRRSAHSASPRNSPRADPVSPTGPRTSNSADGGYSSVTGSSHPPTSDEEGSAMPSGGAFSLEPTVEVE